MIWFVARRAIAMVVTLWVIFTITWILMRVVPGGPYSRDRKLPKATEEAYKRRYNLDLPMPAQYVAELRRVATGDLGLPFKLNDYTVNGIIAQGWPISAALGILAITFALLLGLTAGIVSAAGRGSGADLALMTLATFGIAVPSFVVASLAILLFVFAIPLFPAGGWGTFGQLVLPAMCLGAPMPPKSRGSRGPGCSIRCRKISFARPAEGAERFSRRAASCAAGRHDAGDFVPGAGRGRHPDRLGRHRKDVCNSRLGLALRAGRAAARFHFGNGASAALYRALVCHQFHRRRLIRCPRSASRVAVTPAKRKSGCGRWTTQKTKL